MTALTPGTTNFLLTLVLNARIERIKKMNDPADPNRPFAFEEDMEYLDTVENQLRANLPGVNFPGGGT